MTRQEARSSARPKPSKLTGQITPILLGMLCLVAVQRSAVCFPTHNPSVSRVWHQSQKGLPKTLNLSMSASISNKPFICVDEAVEATNSEKASNIKFVDGSWWLGNSRDAQAEFEGGPRIVGATFFDVDEIAATGDLNPKRLPHMAPPKVRACIEVTSMYDHEDWRNFKCLFSYSVQELFAAAMDEMGILNSSHVVVYGTEGCMFVHRTYYTFGAMGHDPDKLHMMEGSLKEWEAKGGAVDTNPTTAINVGELDLSKSPTYQARDAVGFVSIDEVAKVVKEEGKGEAFVIDARSAGRFIGTESEPRPGLRGGHMPGSYNLPFTELLEGFNGEWTRLKPEDELRQIFIKAGIDIQTGKQIICSCGSGVTASAIAAALEKCGRDRSTISVFDGSWIEWASNPDNLVV
jgi:thiosulfate/3-mercaptopyruvate sulfurtransferase